MDGLACTHLYLAYESPVLPRLVFNSRGLAIAPLGLIFSLFLALPSSAQAVCSATDCQSVPIEVSSIEREVVALQDHLKVLGYFPQEVRSTGYYGEITRTSVEKFQQASGLPVDGIVDVATRTEIDRAIAKSQAEPTNNATPSITTRELQDRLKALGYFPAKVRSTGYYGPITEESVRKFQSAYGLPVNGIADLSTVTQLKALTQQTNSASRGGTLRRMSQTRLSAPRTSAPQRRSGMLRPGDIGLAVLEAKRRLAQYGYTAGVGNLYDTQMVVAVKRFQEDKGLETDGLVGSQTEQLLYAAERGLPSLRKGDGGHLVQLVQYQLNLVPTGEFDAVTEATVKAFQKERDLEETGVVDTQTHKALATHLARLSLVSAR
ncbi:MAG: peptidoglycan-binding protein [Geitlerinemataceae cyanobacterium]